MSCEERYLKVMLDRSVVQRIYQCLELGRCSDGFTVDDYVLFDNWLKNERIEVVKFSIGDIESYHRKPSSRLSIETAWVKNKEEEYKAKVYASTMYMNDINSPVDTATVCIDIGDVDVPPNELNDTIKSFRISEKKKRDVLSLMIAERIHADIFIHYNPKDYERDQHIHEFITKRITSQVIGLETALSEIRMERL